MKKHSPNLDAGEEKARNNNTEKCPVCGADAEYVGFAAYEVAHSVNITMGELLATATERSNAKAIEARNLIVKCPTHGEKIVQRFGHHITGSKKHGQEQSR
jgi:hypothetical protein